MLASAPYTDSECNRLSLLITPSSFMNNTMPVAPICEPVSMNWLLMRRALVIRGEERQFERDFPTPTSQFAMERCVYKLGSQDLRS